MEELIANLNVHLNEIHKWPSLGGSDPNEHVEEVYACFIKFFYWDLIDFDTLIKCFDKIGELFPDVLVERI